MISAVVLPFAATMQHCFSIYTMGLKTWSVPILHPTDVPWWAFDLPNAFQVLSPACPPFTFWTLSTKMFHLVLISSAYPKRMPPPPGHAHWPHVTCCWKGTVQSSPDCSIGADAEPAHCHRWWRTGCGWQSHSGVNRKRCQGKTCGPIKTAVNKCDTCATVTPPKRKRQ